MVKVSVWACEILLPYLDPNKIRLEERQPRNKGLRSCNENFRLAVYGCWGSQGHWSPILLQIY